MFIFVWFHRYSNHVIGFQFLSMFLLFFLISSQLPFDKSIKKNSKKSFSLCALPCIGTTKTEPFHLDLVLEPTHIKTISLGFYIYIYIV